MTEIVFSEIHRRLVLPLSPSDQRGSGRFQEQTTLAERLLETEVLIVEDEMIIAWQMRDLLEDMGFSSVRTAGTYSEAITAAETLAPSLLICDVNLGSGPDGIATAADIARMTSIKPIFVTGYAGEQINARVEAFDPRAKLLRKPIQAKSLRAAIYEVLQGESSHH
ncbi:response regulator [Qipengyuania atrilutea]|uniref:Response regulator n=1 Tax=Qipengyuania atrilutea TaxID=2744473 RepID=A0A850GZ75_9SPHN|nr:response regulator [Actirhodobacter atriluteus]NVD43500.1 response regulator [Actirhodobacter atriluteus]